MPLKIKVEETFWVGDCLIAVGTQISGQLDWEKRVNIIAPNSIGNAYRVSFEDEIIGFETNPNNPKDVAVYLKKATKKDICKGSEIIEHPFVMLY